jgi:RNase P subunit RPR2
VAKSSQVAEQSALPIITCPSCGKHMRLSTILPEEDHRERMTFTCECGVDYRQSHAVTLERGL